MLTFLSPLSSQRTLRQRFSGSCFICLCLNTESLEGRPLRQDSSKLISSQFLHLKLHYWWSALSLLPAWNAKITSMCKTLYNPALNQHSGSDVPPSADVGGWRLLKTQAWKGDATQQEIWKCTGNGWCYMADAKRLSIRHKSGQN